MTVRAADIELVEQSNLFDVDWYLKQYPDVLALGLNPIEHYLRFGVLLNRDPSREFSTRYYLSSNPDVAESGVNPLLHYLRHGRLEGRSTLPYTYSERAIEAAEIEIVIPVFNALADVKSCLESVASNFDGVHASVVVVNDFSDDETTHWLRSFVRDHPLVRLIENQSNLGYTKSVNLALTKTKARFVLLMNSDVIVSRGWLRGLLDCVESSSDIGIAGPLSNAASYQSVPEIFEENQEFSKNEGNPALAVMATVVATCSKVEYPRVGFLNGFCWLMRREVIERVGVFDEVNFPVGYGEENDYCIRVLEAGFDLAVADNVYVFHAKSKSFGAGRKALAEKGDSTLRKKYSLEKIADYSRRGRHSLDILRQAVSFELAQLVVAPSEIDFGTSVLFVLPTRTNSGGAHSILQETRALKELGVNAKIAVREKDLSYYRSMYSLPFNDSSIFVGFNFSGLADLALNYEFVVATTYESASLVNDACPRGGRSIPAYYVQDYEPLFFSPYSQEYQIARKSYELSADQIVFAKTDWLRMKIRAEHGRLVYKVLASVDHNVYRPKPKGDASQIVIAAMIRPKVPWRGAERTMRVLERLHVKYEAKIKICIFGEDSSTPYFRNLTSSFPHMNHGEIKRDDVAGVLGSSHIFLDLSDYQAFGRTAIEAMACGAAVVVPRLGGCGEYAQDNTNCLVVNTESEDDCFDAASTLVDNEYIRTSIARRGLLTASRYSPRGAALSLLDVFARGKRERAARSTVVEPVVDAVEDLQQLAINESVSPLSLTLRSTVDYVQSSLPSQLKKLPLTVLVLTWDIGHNPLGRSYMLAEVIERMAYNVVIGGFQFPRYGNDVWEPVRDSKIPVISLAGSNFPDFIKSLREISSRVKPDIVVACKSRLPSVLLGQLIREHAKCPLIVDIDDHELSFFNDIGRLTLADVAADEKTAIAKDVEPYGERWTRLAESMSLDAEHLIVSNVALKGKFGGTIVPHVRDERVFNPSLYDKVAIREKYGVPPKAKILLFFGTPRKHKGVGELAEAVGAIGRDNLFLVVVGTSTDRSVTNHLNAKSGGRTIYIPNQPFSSVPEILAMADLVCLPQDETHPISKYQLPAKAIDAIAMGVPLLVTRTAPLMQLVEDGVAVCSAPDDIAVSIERLLFATPANADWGNIVRPRFLAKYSYAAAAVQFQELISTLIKTKITASERPGEALRLMQLLSDVFPEVKSAVPEKKGRDVVLFWKQNDTGMYGRRPDMTIKYLASRPDIRKIIVFDAPLSEHDLVTWRNDSSGMVQSRTLYVNAYRKLFGELDSEKISYNLYIYPPGRYSVGAEQEGRTPLERGYIPYIKDVLIRESVDPSESIFWIYPKNYQASALIDYFSPKKIVVDVVDDHRAWPNVAPAEIQRLTRNYSELLGKADLALSNCEPVQRSMSEFCPAIRLVPNGCDESAEVAEPKESAVFAELLTTSRQVIGFVGNLEAKIDIVLIEKVSEAFPEALIVLVGSTHANQAARNLAQKTNVRMPGIVPYNEISAWVSKFDVGMIPHLDMPMTMNMNPLKIFVYMAQRVPVVSTAVGNIDPTTPALLIAQSHDSFISHMKTALTNGPVQENEWREFMRKNSWQSRFESHVDSLLESIS